MNIGEQVEPFLDITSIYQHLQHKQPGKKTPKETKSLATICKELLGISLSKVWFLKLLSCSFEHQFIISFYSAI